MSDFEGARDLKKKKKNPTQLPPTDPNRELLKGGGVQNRQWGKKHSQNGDAFSTHTPPRALLIKICQEPLPPFVHWI